MLLSGAYDMMDLLLDKVDQAYFTTNEKNTFLDLATFEYINKHYKLYGVNQESRDKLKHFTIYRNFANGIMGAAPFQIWTQPNPIQDYMHLISVTVNGKKAKILSYEDFVSKSGDSAFVGGDASSDPFTKPTVNYPIATVAGIGFMNNPAIGLPYEDDSSSNNVFIYYYPGNFVIEDVTLQQASALAVLDATGDSVASIDMVQFGSGYTTAQPPIVTVIDPPGFTGSSVVLGAPLVDNEFITSIPLVHSGSGYNEQPPTLQISPPAPNIPSDNLNFHYIRTPLLGRGSSEFNTFPHDTAMEIIKISVRMMSASIESSNYEVFDSEVNKNQ